MNETYGQTIHGPDGSVSVSGCVSAEDAVYKATDLAIASGWAPPRWWQYWLPSWPENCVEEYSNRCLEGR